MYIFDEIWRIWDCKSLPNPTQPSLHTHFVGNDYKYKVIL